MSKTLRQNQVTSKLHCKIIFTCINPNCKPKHSTHVDSHGSTSSHVSGGKQCFHTMREIAISARSQITQLFIVDAGALTLPLWGWRRRACLAPSVFVWERLPSTEDEVMTLHTPQRKRNEARGEKGRGGGKGAVINMAIKAIWSRRWGSKSRGREEAKN